VHSQLGMCDSLIHRRQAYSNRLSALMHDLLSLRPSLPSTLRHPFFRTKLTVSLRLRHRELYRRGRTKQGLGVVQGSKPTASEIALAHLSVFLLLSRAHHHVNYYKSARSSGPHIRCSRISQTGCLMRCHPFCLYCVAQTRGCDGCDGWWLVLPYKVTCYSSIYQEQDGLMASGGFDCDVFYQINHIGKKHSQVCRAPPDSVIVHEASEDQVAKAGFDCYWPAVAAKSRPKQAANHQREPLYEQLYHQCSSRMDTSTSSVKQFIVCVP